MAKRGKAARHTGADHTSARTADSRRLERALRSLDLVDSRLDLDAWADQVSTHLDRDVVDAYLNRSNEGIEAAYDFTYSSFERAMHFSVGWRSWPLRTELEWMLPRLRQAIDNHTAAGEQPFLVELGSGPGAAAAILSAALKVPVVAVDARPETADLARQFAQRTGGSVEPHVATAAALPEVLGGRKPAAVVAMSTFRYLMPHKHRGGYFSDWAHMKEILAKAMVPADIGRILDAVDGADVLLSEVGCSDFAAEVAAVMLAHGYEIPAGGITRIPTSLPNETTSTVLMAFSGSDTQAAESNLLVAMYSPLPVARVGLSIEDDEAAEAMRWSLEPTELIGASEIAYSDGSGRLRTELFMQDDLLGHYVAATTGFRRLKLYPVSALKDLIDAVIADEKTLVDAGQATCIVIDEPATRWTQ